MKPYQQRVVEEHDELAKKVGNLTTFVNSDRFLSVDQAEQKRLIEQLGVMTQYLGILVERIGAFGDK